MRTTTFARTRLTRPTVGSRSIVFLSGMCTEKFDASRVKAYRVALARASRDFGFDGVGNLARAADILCLYKT
jgi:hypothetical protein